MPPRRVGRSASRRNTPVSPPKSVTDSVQQPRRATRSQSRDLEAVQKTQQQTIHDRDLTALEEEDDAQLDGDESPYVGAQNNAVEIADTAPSAAAPGHAPTSLADLTDDSDSSDAESAEDIDAPDRESMIDNLPQLLVVSNTILSLLSARDEASAFAVVEALKDANSRLAKRLNTQIQTYKTTCVPYSGKSFIRIKPVLNSLLGPVSDDGHDQANPEAVLYLANLAIFTASIVASSMGDVSDTLDFMFSNFPLPFMRDQTISGTSDSAFVDSAAAIGVELCTQFFIVIAEGRMLEENLDPDIVLAQAFFNENPSPGGLRVVDLVADRLKEIREYFATDATGLVDVDALRLRYPFDDFRVAILLWAQAGRQEFQTDISTRGGVDEIVDRLQIIGEQNIEVPEMQTRLVERSAAVQPAIAQVGSGQLPDQKPKGRGSSGLSATYKANVATLKRLMGKKVTQKPQGEPTHNAEAEASRTPQVPEVPQSPLEEEPVPAIGEDGDDQAPIPTQDIQDPEEQKKRILEVIQRQTAQSHKENPKLFISRQESAQRLTWDEAGAATQTSPKRRRLQPQVDEDEDEDEDDEQFETDQRSPKRARRLPQIVQPSRPRVPFEELDPETVNLRPQAAPLPEEEEEEDVSSPQPTPPRPSQPRSTAQRPSSRAPLQPVEPTPSSTAPPSTQRIEQINTLARAAVATHHGVSGSYTPQVRVPWSPEEIERLLVMIAIYRTQYAKIKEEDEAHEEGPRLQGRTQIQLKDKARNLKMDFLKARQPLPRGFESVSIGRKGERILEELGAPYLDGVGGRRIPRRNVTAAVEEQDGK